MPEPIASPGHADSVNGDEFFDGDAVPEAVPPVPPVERQTPTAPTAATATAGTGGTADRTASTAKAVPSNGQTNGTNDPFFGRIDARGVVWNPVKFRLKEGTPQIDALGRFVPLGIGGSPKPSIPVGNPFPRPFAAVANGVSSLPSDDLAPVEEAFIEITGEIAADVAIGLIQTALIMLGEEEGELTPLEAKMLRGPLLRVLAKYHLADKMTPELELGAIIATLVMRRLKKPKTQNWFLARLAWLKGWWNARRLRRAVADPVSS